MIGHRLCSKCKGDLFLERDSNEWSILFLQCGHRTYLGQMENCKPVKGLISSLYWLINKQLSRDEEQAQAHHQLIETITPAFYKQPIPVDMFENAFANGNRELSVAGCRSLLTN